MLEIILVMSLVLLVVDLFANKFDVHGPSPFQCRNYHYQLLDILKNSHRGDNLTRDKK